MQTAQIGFEIHIQILPISPFLEQMFHLPPFGKFGRTHLSLSKGVPTMNLLRLLLLQQTCYDCYVCYVVMLEAKGTKSH